MARGATIPKESALALLVLEDTESSTDRRFGALLHSNPVFLLPSGPVRVMFVCIGG